MTHFNARFERERKERMTPEKIVELAKRRGFFSVSLRWRDDWLRSRCAKLKKRGLLRGGRREGRHQVFYPVREIKNETANAE